ncbi:OLC1v1034238C1 [Oldenlandia corymbosa var. corymbosa]|uniref:OLC1v1034238C1 n=1 Tax=Oldenlandia corymbosa var. corymbosa TaxID=529605 RepID=A0AAV1CQV0_OLDCO|nr:OLC1v1034238C1 [Oldenlandia corymbosa var. corymbosa]
MTSFKLESSEENKEYVVMGTELVPIEFFMEVDDDQEEEEEDDDDLFEIDLNVVNYINPPDYYWDSVYLMGKATTHQALLANCLLPISDISSAVPAAAKPPSLCDHRHRAILMSWASWPSDASLFRSESSMAEEEVEEDDDFMGFSSFDSFEFPQYRLEAIRA